jgi:hypothetical protein
VAVAVHVAEYMSNTYVFSRSKTSTYHGKELAKPRSHAAAPGYKEPMRKITITSILGALLLLPFAAPAAAKDGDILRAGTCTGASTSKIKLSQENRRIEVEFEVDQNRNGVRWTVVLRRNGVRIARLVRVTRPPSGSFEARRLARNGAGAEVIRARAVSRSGEVCTARATFG